jgi:endoglucanase
MLWSAASHAENIDLVGLNIGGAAFSGNVIPGKYKTNYFFPAPGYFAKWKAKGIETLRFPIMWERLQPALNAELDEDYAELIDQTLQQAAQYDMRIILDIHN